MAYAALSILSVGIGLEATAIVLNDVESLEDVRPYRRKGARGKSHRKFKSFAGVLKWQNSLPLNADT